MAAVSTARAGVEGAERTLGGLLDGARGLLGSALLDLVAARVTALAGA